MKKQIERPSSSRGVMLYQYMIWLNQRAFLRRLRVNEQIKPLEPMAATAAIHWLVLIASTGQVLGGIMVAGPLLGPGTHAVLKSQV